MKKMWYHSKSLWFNIITVVSSALVGFGLLQVDLSPETVATILAIINIILRAITGTGLTTDKTKADA